MCWSLCLVRTSRRQERCPHRNTTTPPKGQAYCKEAVYVRRADLIATPGALRTFTNAERARSSVEHLSVLPWVLTAYTTQLDHNPPEESDFSRSLPPLSLSLSPHFLRPASSHSNHRGRHLQGQKPKSSGTSGSLPESGSCSCSSTHHLTIPGAMTQYVTQALRRATCPRGHARAGSGSVPPRGT